MANEAVANLLAKEAGVERADLSKKELDPRVLSLVPADFALEKNVLPLAADEETLTVAIATLDLPTIDELQNLTGLYVEVKYAPEAELIEALRRSYKREAPQEKEERPSAEAAEEVSLSVETAGEEVTGSQVIEMVSSIISLAIKGEATDIHVEPEEHNVYSRFRIDGILQPGPSIPKHFQAAVTARIKIMAGVNIAENRLPQDGKARFTAEGRDFDLRVSTFPTLHGENIVIRILDKERVLLGLEQLGFSARALSIFKAVITRPNGVILVTGPTGSGKTTTLYAALGNVSSKERHIITLEDPVEYEIKGIRQSQINLRAGLTFAVGLRAILRQDPDVILIGEIRDAETVEVAIRAALTGHLVFSTLHTNEALGAIPRLLNMGVEPYLLSSSLVALMAQRLVRVICRECKEESEPGEEMLKAVGFSERPKEKEFYYGKGCAHCYYTGFKGRVGICEIVPITPALIELISQRADTKKLERTAREEGMVPMMEDGLDKVFAGVTSLDEVIRVAYTV